MARNGTVWHARKKLFRHWRQGNVANCRILSHREKILSPMVQPPSAPRGSAVAIVCDGEQWEMTAFRAKCPLLSAFVHSRKRSLRARLRKRVRIGPDAFSK